MLLHVEPVSRRSNATVIASSAICGFPPGAPGRLYPSAPAGYARSHVDTFSPIPAEARRARVNSGVTTHRALRCDDLQSGMASCHVLHAPPSRRCVSSRFDWPEPVSANEIVARLLLPGPVSRWRASPIRPQPSQDSCHHWQISLLLLRPGNSQPCGFRIPVLPLSASSRCRNHVSPTSKRSNCACVSCMRALACSSAERTTTTVSRQTAYWWSCRESNPGPSRLRFGGITAILFVTPFHALANTDRFNLYPRMTRLPPMRCLTLRSPGFPDSGP